MNLCISYLKTCLSSVSIICVVYFSSAAMAQTATPDTIRGAFSGRNGDIQVSFICSGAPTCTGRYAASFRNPGCSNRFSVSDSMTMTGSDIAQPGPIQVSMTFSNARCGPANVCDR